VYGDSFLVIVIKSITWVILFYYDYAVSHLEPSALISQLDLYIFYEFSYCHLRYCGSMYCWFWSNT